MTNLDDAECAARCGADGLGFIFTPSPRQVEPATARAILAALGPFPVGVALFRNASLAMVRETLAATGCSVAQLHGEEDPAFARALAPHAVVKSFRVKDRLAPEQLAPYAGVRAFLLDTYVPGVPGGTGERFDIRIAADLVSHGYRIIVAGGLTPGNVYDVVTTVRPYGVDVCSGVESGPGRKDHHKVADFIAAVRAADRKPHPPAPSP